MSMKEGMVSMRVGLVNYGAMNEMQTLWLVGLNYRELVSVNEWRL